MGIVQASLELAKFAGRLANPELLQRVNALNEQILEISSQNIELQRHNAKLEEDLRDAASKINLIGEVKRRNSYIYAKGETDPCCPRCFDVDKVLVRIIEGHLGDAGRVSLICPQCKTIFVARPEGLSARKSEKVASSHPSAYALSSRYL